jgi:hypothetical protein
MESYKFTKLDNGDILLQKIAINEFLIPFGVFCAPPIMKGGGG